ncbi:MAG: NAD(P)-binding domain-containing protein, partial [Sumerlaeia bacterium]
ILGGGVSGISAAIECQKLGLNYQLLEAAETFTTIINFPKRKPIYLYPTEMKPAGDLDVTADVKEALLDELNDQVSKADLKIKKGVRATHVEKKGEELHVIIPNAEPIRARYVIVAIGRSGNYRKMNIPGEELNKVYNRLHDPAEYKNQQVLVVGGGDSALEATIAMAENQANVTLAYRGKEFSRPKPENAEKIQALTSDTAGNGKIRLLMNTDPKRIEEGKVVLKNSATNQEITLENDHVFALIGREAPLEFFRKSGIAINGEWNVPRMVSFALFLIFCVWLYNWKGDGYFGNLFKANSWFPFNIPSVFASAFGAAVDDASTLVGTLAISMSSPAFYYTFAYTAAVGIFGIQRIRRRKTPYVKVQTITLFFIQALPLFLLPEILLPYFGHNGLFDSGFMATIADNLFPVVSYGHEREYWRAYGFILAWPLFVSNFFTDQPMMWWLAIGSFQTFVIIPTLIYFYGKGAYCGWICSCGALAETMGDAHRQKMPHGPFWSKLNMAGQVILWIAFLLMGLRILGWIFPHSSLDMIFDLTFAGKYMTAEGKELLNPISYKWVVDVSLAGVIGVGFYFWFSGRVWCRFFCPLAALMHYFTKFSRFRIIPDKKKCISCNVCTSVCHQGIDVMNFANKGIAMEDPECVRCSACVQSCPTGVLQFGQVNKKGEVLRYDQIPASPVLLAESQQNQSSERN